MEPPPLPARAPAPVARLQLRREPLPPPPPVRRAEVLAVLAFVALADFALYRGGGYAGFAVWFLGAPALMWLGAAAPRRGTTLAVLAGCLALGAVRLVWAGSPLVVASGFALLTAFAMALSGQRPYALETLAFGAQAVAGGAAGLAQYGRGLRGRSPRLPAIRWLEVGLPVTAVAAFAVVFLLANPDLVTAFGTGLERILDAVRTVVLEIVPGPLEVASWFAVAWLAAGLLRPLAGRLAPAGPSLEELLAAPIPSDTDPGWHRAFRNTLLGLIGLFAAYLVFEVATLWLRALPAGFAYSGYAHQGAAWLTFALALATALLSFMFSSRAPEDARDGGLRRLAWIWSGLNLLLAVAVYHRLWIYVGFNGLTRMRIVGICGTSAVVAGFLLVCWKIAHRRDFVWLVRHQLWALALTVYSYALLPVDALVVGYNVRRILAGDPKPSVMLACHPIGPEGVPALVPLLDAPDPVIRDGIRALCAACLVEGEDDVSRSTAAGWSAFQLVDRRALGILRDARPAWAAIPAADRAAAWDRFVASARRWY